MSGSHRIWQLRQWDTPLIDTRHSKQIPIPHSGPRGSPLTDVLQASPAIATATATVAPGRTLTLVPFTVTVTEPGPQLVPELSPELGMNGLLPGPRRQVGFNGNFGFRPGNLIHQDSRCCQRSRDSEPLMTRC